MTDLGAERDSVSIQHPSHDIEWLRRLGLASAVTTTFAGVAGVVLAMATGNLAFTGVGLVMAFLTTWTLLARRQAARGGATRYVARLSVGLFVGMLALLPLVPALASTIVMACLIPLFMAVPLLDRRALRRWSLAVWAYGVAYVAAASLIGVTMGDGGTDGDDLVLEVVGTAIIVGFVVALIRHYALADTSVRFMAVHDGLTGLCTGALFLDRLEHALALEEPRPSTTAVICLALDGFKAVNDRHGHAYGDKVLRAVADGLRSSVRSADTVARVGGDEFAVLLEGIADRTEAAALADRRGRATSDPMAREGGISIRSSVGIAFSGDGGETAEALLRNADYAMYQSKRGRRGGVVVYHPSLRLAAAERRAVKRALSGVVERDELLLQYQPIVRLHSGYGEASTGDPPAGTIESLEALVRWDDPQRGRRGPDQFIGFAEETGDIVQIGRWVLQEACHRLHDWQRLPGASSLRMAVNLSARQLQRPGFAEDVAAIVADAGIEPSSLVLEITEHVLVRDSALIHGTLQRLRSSGIHLAIDDFGTGYSSFAYLRDFPVDSLKLDRSFLLDAVGRQRGTALLRAMVDVGAGLGATVVAEGIETQAQLDLVRSLGCDLGQGFLLSRPLGDDAVVELLMAENRPWGRVLGVDGSRVRNDQELVA